MKGKKFSMILSQSILFFISLIVSTQGHALAAASFNASSDLYDFNGIARLSNCSGSLIIFQDQPLSSKALVLTNAHCHSHSIMPEAVILNKPLKRQVEISDANKQFHPVTTTSIVYATMTGIDVMLYELTETYSELAAKNITPLMLSPVKPQIDDDIQIISGFWKKGYSCSLDGFVHKLIIDNLWEFLSSMRYDLYDCGIVNGTSGSPIILDGTRQVIGINTAVNGSGKQCTEDSFCEVDEDGSFIVDHNWGYRRGYGQQTHIFYSCLDSNYKIDLTLPECQLHKGGTSSL